MTLFNLKRVCWMHCAAIAIFLSCTPSSTPRNSVTIAEGAHVQVEEEKPLAEILHRAFDKYEKHEFSSSLTLLGDILINYPEHLEANVLFAMVQEAAGQNLAATKTWGQVERIIIFSGKQLPFELQATLSASALHYVKNKNFVRSKLFIDELWRRFPRSDWSVKTQLMAAELEYAQSDWSAAVRSCTEMLRLRPDHPTTARCHELQKNAQIMMEIGPTPDNSSSHWAWENPLPQGNTLNGIWASKNGAVFTVGEAGTILERRPGKTTFSVIPSPTRWSLNRIIGNDENEVYAVGRGGIVLRYDGKQWTVLRQPDPRQENLWGVFSSAARDAIAVGDAGLVLKWQQGKWNSRRITSVGLHAIWGPDNNELFVAGDGGAVFHYSKQHDRWNSIPADCYEDLQSLWGLSNEHVFAVGKRRTIMYFDGKQAKESIIGQSDFHDTWGFGLKQTWVVGTNGEILRYDGKTWLPEKTGTLVNLNGIAGSKPDDLWAVGEGGTILKRQNKRWNLVAGGIHHRLIGVSVGATKKDNYALGEQGTLLRWNKGKWLTDATLPLGHYRSFWSDGAKTMAAVGDRGLWAIRRGNTWKLIKTDTPEDLNAIWGWKGGMVAVGSHGTILRLIGDKIIKDPSPSGLDLYSVWGASDNHLIAVGRRGVTLLYNGEQWTETDSGVLTDLNTVWGISAKMIFAGGKHGAIFQYNKSRWQPMLASVAQDIVGIWGDSLENLFAISNRGSILKYRLVSWEVQNSPTHCLNAIHGHPSSGVLAVGCYGGIIRWQP